MGSSSSSLGAQTHAQAFTNTERTRMIMDDLLNYMIKQLSVRDLLHMSKESECKKYVLFKANAIYQYFHELRVFPVKDAKGLLTFRRVEDLVNPKGEQEKERQSLCLIVAYFYTRIFQIYGALALTLIDEVDAMASSGLMTTFKRGSDARTWTPGRVAQPAQSYRRNETRYGRDKTRYGRDKAPYGRYETSYDQPYGWDKTSYDEADDDPYFGPYRRGGARELLDPTANPPPLSTVSLKIFEWIRSFLTADIQPSIGYKTRYTGSGEDKGAVSIKIEDFLRDSADKPIPSYGIPPANTYQNATCFIAISGGKKYHTLEFYTLQSPDDIKVKIGNLTFTNKRGETIVVNKFNQTFHVKRDQQSYVVMISNKPVSDVPTFMAGIFSDIIVYLRDAIEESKETIYLRGNHGEHGIRKIRGTHGYSGYSGYGTRSNRSDRSDRSTIPRKEDGIASHLKVEKMIDDLTVRRPLGHCIARALQLLKTEPLANQPGISQICSVAFDGKSSERIGLPKSGKPLSDHPGLFALANLFYDTIIIGSPNLTIGKNRVDGQRSTFQDYVAFMTKLSEEYLNDQPLTPQEMEKKGLSGITNKRDEMACPTAEEIPLSLDTTTKVHAIVKSMFQMQVKHAAKCETIISMLFTITKDPVTKKPIMFKLNDNVIRRGFPELERINRMARNILVEYYTNCEDKYWNGMKFVLTGQKDKVKADEQAKAKAKAKEDADKKRALDAEQAQIAAAKATPNPVIAQAEARKLATQQATQVPPKPRVAARREYQL